MRFLLIQQRSIGGDLNNENVLWRINEVGCGQQLTSVAIERSIKSIRLLPAVVLCAFLELFHSGDHPNSGAIDITVPVSGASSCNDHEIPKPEHAHTRIGE
jgi:hypothetical protein